MHNRWLKGETATDHDILPEIKSYIAKARLRRGIEMVKLANRIEALRMQDDEQDSAVPDDAGQAAAQATAQAPTPAQAQPESKPSPSRRLSRAARSEIFRAIVLAKVREMKSEEEKAKVERTLTEFKDKPKQ